MLVMKRGKDCVKFEVTDGEVESVVTLLPDDDQETLVRKLRRVIALAEPEAPGARIVTPEAFRKGMGELLEKNREARAALAAMKPPEIPDHLKGVIELEDAPAEPAIGNGWGEGPPRA